MTKQKIIKGGVYLTSVNALTQFLSIGVNVLLARILIPEDFGLLALTMTFIGLVTLFSSLGFGASIIHESELNKKMLSTIFWLNLGLAIFSFFLVILTSGMAASFYGEPQLADLTKLAALSILISPLFVIPYKLLEKELEFQTLSKINLSGTVIGSLSAVIFAYLGFGVYALVAQSIVSMFVRMVLVLINKPWKPDIAFDYVEIKDMVWYSLKFKASNIAFYFERNLDYLILGKFFSSVILGYYAFAYNIMYTPVKRISYIFSEVLFPSFSSFKNDRGKIMRGYFKSVKLISMVSIPAMTILACNAELIIQFVFGHQWDGAIKIVQILCFAGAIQAISQFGTVIFSSIGKPEVELYVSIARSVLTLIAILIGVQFGILWVAAFILFSKILSYLVFLFVLIHHIPFTLQQLWSSIKDSVITFLVLCLMYLVHKWEFIILNPVSVLVIMLSLFILLFYFFQKKTLISIYSTLKGKEK